eukprot:TRINITY_DN32256_c0_g1_i1.p1 TRINITY_DN32256_c0_g1~~TRINITY_DN32256_c0_g1_i1.p1  ORF type:complete len:392 (+),score=83.02 TRINITY_DN32256_c0_g1_i1:72-1247(+)
MATKVAVLGASKFGRFHARELAKNNFNVCAVLGSTTESAKATAEKLPELFPDAFKAFANEKIRSYSNLEQLLAEEVPRGLGAVSICLPPKMHFEAASKCLDAGLQVLLEKPAVWNSARGEGEEAKRERAETQKEWSVLVGKAEEKKVCLAVQLQMTLLSFHMAKVLCMAHPKFCMNEDQQSKQEYFCWPSPMNLGSLPLVACESSLNVWYRGAGAADLSTSQDLLHAAMEHLAEDVCHPLSMLITLLGSGEVLEVKKWGLDGSGDGTQGYWFEFSFRPSFPSAKDVQCRISMEKIPSFAREDSIFGLEVDGKSVRRTRSMVDGDLKTFVGTHNHEPHLKEEADDPLAILITEFCKGKELVSRKVVGSIVNAQLALQAGMTEKTQARRESNS